MKKLKSIDCNQKTNCNQKKWFFKKIVIRKSLKLFQKLSEVYFLVPC